MEENNISPGPAIEKKGINPLLFIIVVIIVVGVGIFVFMNKKPAEQASVVQNPITQTTQVGSETTQLSDVTTSVIPAENVKEFNIDGKSFEFNPKTLTVNKGDTVKINFTDSDGMHDLVIDGYNLRTKIVRPGGSDTLTFVADKEGSFKYYCSVSNHEDLGMTGILVVQ